MEYCYRFGFFKPETGERGLNLMAQTIQAFIWTVIAGLTMVIGGVVAASGKKTSDNLLSVIMGFSAGLLIYISFMELLPESLEYMEQTLERHVGYMIMIAAFLAGIAIVALINRFSPCPCELHEHDDNCTCKEHNHNASGLYKAGFASMIAISLHNLPEGFAIFSSTLHNASVGLSLVLAVALHNVPEGLAIAMPVYKATGNKAKAVLMSLYAGLCTPVGAIIGMLVFGSEINPLTMGIVFAVIAGTMVFVALSELYPSAMHHGKKGTAMCSVVAGMIFMALVMLVMNHHH